MRGRGGVLDRQRCHSVDRMGPERVQRGGVGSIWPKNVVSCIEDRLYSYGSKTNNDFPYVDEKNDANKILITGSSSCH